MEPSISIIIPAFNAENYIERCIKSCLNQTYRYIEILVIDDGSNDSTYDICRKLQMHSANIKLIEKKNSGVSDTRNYGIQNAEGEFILFLDADDYINEDYCETLISHFTNDIDLVIAGYHKVSKTGILSSEIPKSNDEYGESEKIDLINDLLECNCLCTCWNKMYRRNKIVTGFRRDMSFAEDSVFVMQYIKNCATAKVINYIGYNYWIDNTGSAMNRYHNNMFEMFVKEFNAICDIDSTKIRLKKIAFSHYMDNLFYWGLPQLVLNNSMTLEEKLVEMKKIGYVPDFSQNIKLYTAHRRKHKIWTFLIEHKMFSFLYLWLFFEFQFKC